ncbi:hypothetical protein RIVERRIDER_7 [Xanthomonas phage RiverRider]|uniref:Uncharacterized protein n=1 Tax=Xanthomonas phage RiverRider TaxID=2108116 RepID=A0A2P1JUQ9_9CAUD|nr:hypothetical protein HWB58_gp07 [Xanthomonas phage RiverRider]AVO23095.1 hypothetical protein RIVERRIDER_7 [Xanthomonas phage RiverRider]
MSNRLDRSLGVKPVEYHPISKKAAPQPKGFTLKVKTVIMVMLIAITAAALYQSSGCVQGVRCTD